MTFEKIQKRAVAEWEALQSNSKPRLLVGAGTCGSAAGALDVLKAINEELERQSIEAIVIQVGVTEIAVSIIVRVPLARISH